MKLTPYAKEARTFAESEAKAWLPLIEAQLSPGFTAQITNTVSNGPHYIHIMDARHENHRHIGYIREP